MEMVSPFQRLRRVLWRSIYSLAFPLMLGCFCDTDLQELNGLFSGGIIHIFLSWLYGGSGGIFTVRRLP